jgi:hypothetical protein
MAKRSGSKSSRSGRKAGKERAVRARERGLPQAAPESDAPRLARVRAATPEPRSAQGEDRSSDAPSPGIPKSAGLSSGTKLAIAAAILLGGLYVLSRFRDASETTAAPEPPGSAAPVIVTTEAEPLPSAVSPSIDPSSPPAAAPVSEPETPAAPVVEPSAPVVSPPAKPSVPKPVAPKPVAAAPKPVAPAAPPASPAVPAVPAPAPAPAPAKPADNPY